MITGNNSLVHEQQEVTKEIYLEKSTSETYWAYFVSLGLCLPIFTCPFQFVSVPFGVLLFWYTMPLSCPLCYSSSLLVTLMQTGPWALLLFMFVNPFPFLSHLFHLLFFLHLLLCLNLNIYFFPTNRTEVQLVQLTTFSCACILPASARLLVPHFTDLANCFCKYLVWRGQGRCLTGLTCSTLCS